MYHRIMYFLRWGEAVSGWIAGEMGETDQFFASGITSPSHITHLLFFTRQVSKWMHYALNVCVANFSSILLARKLPIIRNRVGVNLPISIVINLKSFLDCFAKYILHSQDRSKIKNRLDYANVLGLVWNLWTRPSPPNFLLYYRCRVLYVNGRVPTQKLVSVSPFFLFLSQFPEPSPVAYAFEINSFFSQERSLS